jgi:hypothetical protein
MPCFPVLLRASVGLALFLGCASEGWAESKASSPNVKKGVLELEYGFVDHFDDASAKAFAEHELEIKYGLTDRLRPQLEFEFEDARGEHLKLSAFSIGAQYQFTKKDEAWLESAVRLNYDFKPYDAEEVRARLILQKRYGKYRQRMTLRANQEVGDDAQDGGAEWRMLLSSRYQIMPDFEIAAELDSSVGQSRDFGHYERQKHYIGPAIYGEISEHLEYTLGYSFGISDAASDGAARFEIEYAVPF